MKTPISEFWDLFESRKTELKSALSSEDPAYNELLEALKRINGSLFIEFSSNSDPPELIVTSDGDKALFQLVDEIVSFAPNDSEWKIIALKPKNGFPESVTWEGYKVTVKDVVFDPLDSDGLAIRMYIEGINEIDIPKAHNGLLRALDHALGERSFSEDIEYADVLPLPENSSADDFIPILELDRYIDWHKSKKVEPDGSGQ